jgi:Phage portal protein, lambda family
MQMRCWFPTFGKLTLKTTRYIANKTKFRSAHKIHRGVCNWYEMGWPQFSTGDRSFLPALIQDARWDQNFVTRREMMRQMRYWSQNSGIVEAILSVGERYTVGSSGLHVAFYPDEDISADADNSWYDRAEQVVKEWFNSCGFNGESMEQLLKIGFRCQKVDGEIFYVKTHKAMPLSLGNRTLQVQKPCLQMVEAHRCESPWNRFEQEGNSLVDGVQFDKTVDVGLSKFTKTGYWMRSGLSSFEQMDSWEFVEAKDVFHIFNPHRVNQFRGLSDFYSVGVLINKLEDILEIEMRAQEHQSVRAVGITNAGGSANVLDKKFERLGGFGLKPAAAQPVNGGELDPRKELYRKEYGAYTYFLKQGEDVKFDSPNRPSKESITLFELLINQICSGTKSPRCLIIQHLTSDSARSQGTEVRAELDNADLFYKGDFQKWKRLVIEVVSWFMEWAVKNDPRLVDPPADWKSSLHVQQPESCSVDVGYTTQANLTMLAAGVIDYEMITGPMGMSFMTVAKRLKRQQDWLRKNNVEVFLPSIAKGTIPLDGKQPAQQLEEANA